MLNLEVPSQRSERLRRKNCLFQITEEPNEISLMGSNRSGQYPGALSQEIQLQDEDWAKIEPKTAEALGMQEQASGSRGRGWEDRNLGMVMGLA